MRAYNLRTIEAPRWFLPLICAITLKIAVAFAEVDGETTTVQTGTFGSESSTTPATVPDQIASTTPHPSFVSPMETTTTQKYPADSYENTEKPSIAPSDATTIVGPASFEEVVSIPEQPNNSNSGEPAPDQTVTTTTQSPPIVTTSGPFFPPWSPTPDTVESPETITTHKTPSDYQAPTTTVKPQTDATAATTTPVPTTTTPSATTTVAPINNEVIATTTQKSTQELSITTSTEQPTTERTSETTTSPQVSTDQPSKLIKPCDAAYDGKTGREICEMIGARCVEYMPVLRCRWPEDPLYNLCQNTIPPSNESINALPSTEDMAQLKEQSDKQLRLIIVMSVLMIAMLLFTVVIVGNIVIRLMRSKRRLERAQIEVQELGKRPEPGTSGAFGRLTDRHKRPAAISYNNQSFDAD